jgi:hypothetical protein
MAGPELETMAPAFIVGLFELLAGNSEYGRHVLSIVGFSYLAALLVYWLAVAIAQKISKK